MPRVGFEPTFSAGERPKTYALDRAVTGISFVVCDPEQNKSREWGRPSHTSGHSGLEKKIFLSTKIKYFQKVDMSAVAVYFSCLQLTEPDTAPTLMFELTQFT